VLLLLIVGTAPQLRAQEESAESAAQPAPAEATHAVKREALRIEVTAEGVFEPEQMWPVVLRPENWTAFTVVDAVAHGAEVKKGDTLVTLDTGDIDEQLEDLEKSVHLSELTQRLTDHELELLHKTTPLDLKAAEQAKRIADENLAYFLNVDRAFQEESARFSLKSSQDSLEYAREELEQLEKMYKADDLTEETEEIILKRARNDVERAEFYLKSTELRTAQTLETDLPREEQQLVQAAQRADNALAKSAVALPIQLEKQQIEREKQLVEDQRTRDKLAKLQRDRETMDVRAPADGIVYYGKWTRGKWSGADSAASQLEEGGKLSPHAVFMTIVNRRPLRIRVEVPEKELHRLQTGVTGKAVPTGYPGLELPASIQQVSPVPVSSGTFDAQVQVALGDDAKAVVPGMGCQLTFVVYDKQDALTVPPAAVFEDEADGKRNVVYVKQQDAAPQKRKIVVGEKTEKKWEVLEGLQEGDVILMTKPDKT
jgi:multidrug resistance efflux pump